MHRRSIRDSGGRRLRRPADQDIVQCGRTPSSVRLAPTMTAPGWCRPTATLVCADAWFDPVHGRAGIPVRICRRRGSHRTRGSRRLPAHRITQHTRQRRSRADRKSLRDAEDRKEVRSVRVAVRSHPTDVPRTTTREEPDVGRISGWPRKFGGVVGGRYRSRRPGRVARAGSTGCRWRDRGRGFHSEVTVPPSAVAATSSPGGARRTGPRAGTRRRPTGSSCRP
jgi:hypothetical protein